VVRDGCSGWPTSYNRDRLVRIPRRNAICGNIAIFGHGAFERVDCDGLVVIFPVAPRLARMVTHTSRDGGIRAFFEEKRVRRSELTFLQKVQRLCYIVSSRA
jgi:hypothetical protein